MSSNPPWKELVESTLAENMKQGSKDSLNIQLATMPLASAPQRPSVRTVVFRGFAGQPRKPDGEPTGGNTIKGVTSSLIVCSSDRLMLKSKQLLQQQQQQQGGSAAGNGFEVCWWHVGTQEQIRLAGKAWLLTAGGDDHHDAIGFPGARLKRDLIHLPQEDGGEVHWTWEGERLRQFAKHSPSLRASFQNPEPASPLTASKAEAVKAGTELPESLDACRDAETRQRVETALERFCLVVLECEQVDYLKVDPPPSRKQWTLEGTEWKTQDVSP